MAKITYENKVALNVNSDIADVNKCNATDLNEIKNVVNENDDNTITNTNNIAKNAAKIGTLSSLNTTNKNNLVSAINEVNNNDVLKGTYSTNETRIGTWMGKPLYRKVLSTVGLSGTTKKSINYNITNPDKIWIVGGFIYSAARVVTLPMVGYDGDLAQKVDVWVETRENVVKLYSNGGWGNDWTFYIIINYTKTTD